MYLNNVLTPGKVPYLICTAALLFTSCTDVVDVPLEQETVRLVVEGGIQTVKEKDTQSHSLTLTTTFDFYSTEAPPPASGAIVYVEDSQGLRYDFEERPVGSGIYTNTELTGEVGERYTLTIEFEGDVYKGEEQMIGVPAIEAIYATFRNETAFDDEGYRTSIDFQDPENEENYYLYEYYVDGQRELLPDLGNKINLVLRDDFFNGQLVEGYQPSEDTALQVGQHARVRQIGISKATYDYYFVFFDQTARIGFFFDTPPAPVFGNIQNTTNPDHYPLGYFLVAEVSERELVISDNAGS